MILPPPNFTVGYSVIRVMCSGISPPNMVCCVTAKKYKSHLTRVHAPSSSLACPNVVWHIANELQHIFFSVVESCGLSVHRGQGGGVHCLLSLLSQLYLLPPSLSGALS